MPTRKFTSTATPLADKADTVAFDLGGVGVLTKEPWEEHFECVPVMPAGVLDDLTSSVSVNAEGRMIWNQVSLLRFIRGILLDDDAARFDRLVHDKDRVVELDTLGDIMIWLSQEMVGTPTIGPSSSGAGRPSTGPGSTPA